MQVDYTNLSEEAKVYIYPSSRKFYDKEIENIDKKINTFLDTVFVDYAVNYKILYNRFIIIFISEEKLISIELLDKLAMFIFSLEIDYKITLLDKVNICFKQGEFVQYQEMKRFRELIKKRSVSKKTILFNNLIQNKHEFENHFEVVASESWLSYLFK